MDIIRNFQIGQSKRIIKKYKFIKMEKTEKSRKILEHQKEKYSIILQALKDTITPDDIFLCSCDTNDIESIEKQIDRYKALINDISSAISTLEGHGVISIRENSYAFDIAEDILFDEKNGWVDECCGNFVGWCKDYKDFTLSINRVDAQFGGRYNFSKMKLGYRASYNYEDFFIESRKLSFNKMRDMVNYFDNF
jgi:hypothetical protein